MLFKIHTALDNTVLGYVVAKSERSALLHANKHFNAKAFNAYPSLVKPAHVVQYFAFNNYKTACRDAMHYSKKYYTSWYVVLKDDGYYAMAHADLNLDSTVKCYFNGEDWTNV